MYAKETIWEIMEVGKSGPDPINKDREQLCFQVQLPVSVRGRWADVPHGRIMGHGEIHLQILSPNHLRATHRTGRFGGNER